MLIDCFLFYNEFKMLELRLITLYDIVDYFILVESTKTFVGNPKKLYFNENKNKYQQYLSKIIHIIVEDMPETNNPWIREKHQRNCIQRGINKLSLTDSDIIIISDVDEIPNSQTITNIKKSGLDGIFCLESEVYCYNLNNKFDFKWYHPKIINYKNYKNLTPDTIRLSRAKIIQKGGWHFAYFMNPDMIINKLKNFSHQEFNNDNYTNKSKIEYKIENHIDLFGNQDPKFVPIELNNYLPKDFKILLEI